jgi:CheY-specific phosphatase CheX
MGKQFVTMPIMNDGAISRLRSLLGLYVGRAVPDLFAANGTILSPAADEGTDGGYSIAGIIGFVGDLSGTLLLGSGPDLVRGSHPMRKTKSISTDMQLDWIGELANQTVGRLSIRLAAHDVHFEFSPPISVMGERMRHVGSKGQTFRAAFGSPLGDVRVWIDADVTDAVVDKKGFYEDLPDSEGPEGKMTLF